MDAQPIGLVPITPQMDRRSSFVPQSKKAGVQSPAVFVEVTTQLPAADSSVSAVPKVRKATRHVAVDDVCVLYCNRKEHFLVERMGPTMTTVLGVCLNYSVQEMKDRHGVEVADPESNKSNDVIRIKRLSVESTRSDIYGVFWVKKVCVKGSAKGHVTKTEKNVVRQQAVLKLQKSKATHPQLTDKEVVRFAHECAAESHTLQVMADKPGIITPYIAGILNNDQVWMLMERAQGDLVSLLQKGNKISLEDAFHITSDVLKAVLTLHSDDCVHGDIKCENLLCVKDGKHHSKIKLADFGSATDARAVKATDDESVPGYYYGTTEFMAPESQFSHKKHQVLTKASDIWSTGCVLGQISGLMHTDEHSWRWTEGETRFVTGHPDKAAFYKVWKETTAGDKNLATWCQEVTGHSFDEYVAGKVPLVNYDAGKPWEIQLVLVTLACMRFDPRHRPTIEELNQWIRTGEEATQIQQSQNTGCCTLL